jgi:hypothetical protein
VEGNPQDAPETGNAGHDCGLRANKMQSKRHIWKICEHETEAVPHPSGLEQPVPNFCLAEMFTLVHVLTLYFV